MPSGDEQIDDVPQWVAAIEADKQTGVYGALMSHQRPLSPVSLIQAHDDNSTWIAMTPVKQSSSAHGVPKSSGRPTQHADSIPGHAHDGGGSGASLREAPSSLGNLDRDAAQAYAGRGHGKLSPSDASRAPLQRAGSSSISSALRAASAQNEPEGFNAPANAFAPSSSFGSGLATPVHQLIESLRQELEDKNFQILELRSENMMQTAALRKENAEKCREIASLQLQVTQSGNKVISTALANNDGTARMREENQLLRLKIRSLEDERDALAAYTTSGHVPAALAAAQHEISVLQQRLEHANGVALDRSSALDSKTREVADIRAHVAQQQDQIRHLQHQLSSFMELDGGNAARADAAEAEVVRLSSELNKRLRQLHKVVEALERVREREAAATAAMEAHSTALAQAQAGLVEATAEADRWRSAVEILQKQHAESVDEVERYRERVETMERQRSEEGEALINAMKSAEAVRALTKAMEITNAENEMLKAQLADIRAESKKELLGLQRRCDEKAGVIADLQAELRSATSAALGVTASGGAVIDGSALFANVEAAGVEDGATGKGPLDAHSDVLAELRSVGGDTIGTMDFSFARSPHQQQQSHYARSQNPRSVGYGNGGSVSASKTMQQRLPHFASTSYHPSSVSGGGLAPSGLAGKASAAELTQLRLQCEGLSRRLQAREDRLQQMEGEQEQLFEINERLRNALDGMQIAAASGERMSQVPGLQSALQHAQEMKDRYSRYVKAAVARRLDAELESDSNAIMNGAAISPAMPLSSSLSPPARSEVLIQHVLACDAAMAMMARLMPPLHGLLTALRQQLDGDSPDGDGSSIFGGGGGGRAGSDGLLDVYSSSATGDAIVQARVTRCAVPAAEVLKIDDGTLATSQKKLPATLLDPKLLLPLIKESLDAVVSVRSELSERAAMAFGSSCNQQ